MFPASEGCAEVDEKQFFLIIIFNFSLGFLILIFEKKAFERR